MSSASGKRRHSIDVPASVDIESAMRPSETPLCSAYGCKGGTKCAVVSWIVVATALLLTAILVPLDYGTVRVGHYGLEKGRSSGVVDSVGTVYGNGYHAIGVGNEFLIYSAQFSPIVTLSKVFTPTGDELDLRARLLVRIRKDRVGEVYERYRDEYLEQVEAIVVSSIKAVNNGDDLNPDRLYTPEEYVTKRQEIRNKSLSEIEKRLRPQGFEVYREYFSFTVDLPDNVDVTSLQRVVETMRERVIELQQQVDVFNAETASLEGAIRANRSAILSTAETEAAAERARGETESRAIEGSAVGLGMQSFFNATNVTAVEDKILMIRYLQERGTLQPSV